MSKESEITLKNGKIRHESIYGYHYSEEEDDIILELTTQDDLELLPLKEIASVRSWVEYRHPGTNSLAEMKQEKVPEYERCLVRSRKLNYKYTLLAEFYSETIFDNEISRGVSKEFILHSGNMEHIDKYIEKFGNKIELKEFLKSKNRKAIFIKPYRLILETEIFDYEQRND